MRGAGSSQGPCAGTPRRAARRPSCAAGKSPCLTAPWDPCGRPRLQPTTGRPGQQVPRNPKALHLQNTVAEHVDDLRIAPVWDPLLVRAVKVDVPVQPQRRPVAVDQAQEGLETDVGPVLPVPEAEGRRVGDKNPRRRTPEEASAPDPGRQPPRPAAHLAPRVLVRTAGVHRRAGEPGERHALLASSHLYHPAVQGYAAAWVLRTVGGGVVVAQDVVDRGAEEGYDVLQVVEGEVPAGDDRLRPPRVGVQTRPVPHGLHLIAYAQNLHGWTRSPTTHPPA